MRPSGSTLNAQAAAGDLEQPRGALQLGGEEKQPPASGAAGSPDQQMGDEAIGPTTGVRRDGQELIRKTSVVDLVVDRLKVLQPTQKPKIMDDVSADPLYVITDKQKRQVGHLDYFDLVAEQISTALKAAANRAKAAASVAQEANTPVVADEAAKEAVAAATRERIAHTNEITATVEMLSWKIETERKRGVDTFTNRDQGIFEKAQNVLQALLEEVRKKDGDDETRKNYLTSGEFWTLWQNIMVLVYAFDRASVIEIGVYLYNNLALPQDQEGNTQRIMKELKDAIDNYFTPEEKQRGIVYVPVKERSTPTSAGGPQVYG